MSDLRKDISTAKQDRCPKCGGELDTGWECNDCGFDAMPLAYNDLDRARERRKLERLERNR